MTDGDLMAQLPKHVRAHILSYLDAESIINCSRVDRDWDELTDLLQPGIWFKACLRAGIHVEKEKYRGAREWKAFVSSMVQRLKDMKISNCFNGVYYPCSEPLKAISYHSAKVAIAFGYAVLVLDTLQDPENCYSILPCDYQPSFLKFDGNTLVAASTSGHISCWSTTFYNHFNEYNVPERSLLSIDFLTQYSIMVASIQKDDSASIIYIWRTVGNRVCKRVHLRDKIIHRVLLAPQPDSPVGNHKRKICLLFCLAEECVRVWTVEIRNRTFSVQIWATLKIPPDPNLHGDIDGTPPFGILFDGTELFITTPSPGRSPSIVWAWNFRKNVVRYIENSHPIINLVGVGKKYLVYKIRNENERDDTVCAVDKITNENVVLVSVPRLLSTSDSLICIGQTSWMDGLNGENDSGVLCASVREMPPQVCLIKFLPRRY